MEDSSLTRLRKRESKITKPHLSIIVSHRLAYRSLFESNLLEELSHRFDLKIMVISEANEMSYGNTASEKRIDFISRGKRRKFIGYLNAKLAWFYWNKVSTRGRSFEYRCLRDQKNLSRNLMKIVLANRRRLGNTQSLLGALRYLINRATLSKIFWGLPSPEQNRILYLDTGGVDSLTPELSFYCQRRKIDLFVMFENWDNINSKAIFSNQHPELLVWGPQAVKFAEDIHGFPKNKVTSIGNIRLSIQRTYAIVPSNSRTILFAGGSLGFTREFDMLIGLARFLETTQDFSDVIIKYLPHPKRYRLIEEKFLNLMRANIKLVENRNREPESNSWLLPKLEDYRSLFEECRMLVSPMSTMNLEALCLGLPSIAIDEEISDSGIIQRMNTNLVSELHDHLLELKKLSCVRFVNSAIELETAVLNVLLEKTPVAHQTKGCNCDSYFVSRNNSIARSIHSKIITN